ncbi:unnamed protein product [Brassicogethes aeneus]|uniref:Uncharacterized protein n=1 Tax=Brassicogethes aeneus TaxID=1431903 RepID=A0A9P0FKU1_BRAAE|nr:unnamed protein product [Brassicogethes aeneus]
MSILDQARTLPHMQSMPPGSQPLLPPHNIDGSPNSEVLLALLARNKALEGHRSRALKNVWKVEWKRFAQREIRGRGIGASALAILIWLPALDLLLAKRKMEL